MKEQMSKSQNIFFFHILTRLNFSGINILEINFRILQKLLMKKILIRITTMKNTKKGDIAFKFSFPLMLCINVY